MKPRRSESLHSILALLAIPLLALGGCSALTCGGHVVMVGEELSDRMWSGPCEYYFKASEGDVVTIAMDGSSPGLDPQLRLLGPDGEEVAIDDDGGGNGNSLISGLRLPSTGRYTILAESYGASQGEFTLSLEAGPPE